MKYFYLTGLLLFTCSIVFGQNLEHSKWATVNTHNLPQERHECCFVEVDGLFYLLGGRRIKPVNIYDPKTLTWKEGAAPPIEIHHFQAVVYEHKIYVFCAMTGKYPHETPIENIFVYNPKKDKWETGSEVPVTRRRGSAGAVVSNGRAIIISGIIDGHSAGFVKWVDEYNFKTGKWKELADAPRPRDHFSAAIQNGKIYCAGGRNSSNATNQTFELTIAAVDVYDIKNNNWITLPSAANIPTQRAGTSTAFIGDDLLVIGGESAYSNLDLAHNEVEALNFKTNQWHKLSPLERGRHGTQVIQYKNVLYIAAGSGKKGGIPELSSLEELHYEL